MSLPEKHEQHKNEQEIVMAKLGFLVVGVDVELPIGYQLPTSGYPLHITGASNRREYNRQLRLVKSLRSDGNVGYEPPELRFFYRVEAMD